MGLYMSRQNRRGEWKGRKTNSRGGRTRGAAKQRRKPIGGKNKGKGKREKGENTKTGDFVAMGVRSLQFR